MREPTAEIAARWAARILSIVLAIGGFSAILAPFYFSFRLNWPDDVYTARLILGGIAAAVAGLALFVQVLVLLGRRKADAVLRSKVFYSTLWGGPIGWVWSVFLLTRKKGE